VLAAAKVPHVYSLTKLGQIFGTDKVDAQHTRNGRAYTDVYERYLRPWRMQRFTLLELGVFRGDSLRMWNAFFPRATVVGLDLEQTAAERAPEFDVAVGSQADPEVLDGILERHPDIRVVVDDASHITSLTLRPSAICFPGLLAAACTSSRTLRRTRTRTGRGTARSGARIGRRSSRTPERLISIGGRTWTLSSSS
jgi:hypothetical protein